MMQWHDKPPDREKSDLNEVLTHNFWHGKYYVEYLNSTF